MSIAAELERPRDTRIDALRGLAITLVVLGHSLVRATPVYTVAGSGLVAVAGVGWIAASTAAHPLLDIIYSFHIPLFAFVSGFVLLGSRSGLGWRFVVRRFRALMIPYFAWLGIGWLSVGERSARGLARFMAAGAVSPQAPGALWFLYALFMSSVVLALVVRISVSPRFLAISAVIIGVAGVIPLGAYDHFLGLAEVAWVYPFLVAGLVFATRRASFDQRARWALPLSFVVWVATLVLISPAILPGPRWWFAPLGAALGSLALPGAPLVLKGLWAIARVTCALAGVLTFYYGYAYVVGRARDVQAWIGQRSIGIYALQAVFLVPFSGLWGWRHATILFAVAMSGSVLGTLLLEQFRWTRVVLLGKHKA